MHFSWSKLIEMNKRNIYIFFLQWKNGYTLQQLSSFVEMIGPAKTRDIDL